MTPDPQHDIQSEQGLDLLGVAGLAAAVMYVGAHASNLAGEALEWRLYMLLGTVFPAALVGIPAALRRWPGLLGWFHDLRALARAIGLTLALMLAVGGFEARTLGLAAVCVLFASILDRRAGRGVEVPEPPRARAIRSLGEIVVLLAGATALPRMIYPMFSFDDGWTYHFAWSPMHWWQTLWLLVTVGAFGWVLHAGVSRPLGRRARAVACSVGALVLIAGAMRLPDFSYWIPYHHWGVFVGPVDLVRDGGLLLWNVPGQYGFLSMLTVAAVPVADSWDAFRLVQAAFLAFSALFLFGNLFALKPSPAGFVAALGLAFTGVYVVPGETHHLRGVFCYPSFGAFRFWPTYALMGLAVWESRGLVAGAAPGRRRAPWVVGSMLWAIAVLWAVEAAVYATAVWLPALAWSRFVQARRGGARPLDAARVAAAHLALPFALLAVACAGIFAWYRLVPGVTPDLSGYFEYAASFRDFLPLLVQPLGPGLVVFVVFLLVSTALSRAFFESDRADLQVVTLAAWGAVWSATSYFVPRSPPANATALLPVLIAAVLVVWRAWGTAGTPWRGPERWVASTFLALVFFTGTYEPVRLPAVGKALVQDPLRPMADVLPRVPKPLEALMYRAGIAPGDRVIHLHPNVMETFSIGPKPGLRFAELHRATPWLPLYPGAMSHPLSHDRWREYVDRYAADHGVDGGWYIKARRKPYMGKGYLWKLDQLMDERYPVVEQWTNADFVIEWRGFGEPPRREGAVRGWKPWAPIGEIVDPIWMSPTI